MSINIIPATPGPTIETTEITDGAVTPPKLDRAYIEKLNGIAQDSLTLQGTDPHLTLPDINLDIYKGFVGPYFQASPPQPAIVFSHSHGALFAALDQDGPGYPFVMVAASAEGLLTPHLGIVAGPPGTTQMLTLFHDSTDGFFQSTAGNINLNPESNVLIAQGIASTPATTYLRVIGQDATHYGEIRAEYGTDGSIRLALYQTNVESVIRNTLGDISLYPYSGTIGIASIAPTPTTTLLRIVGQDATHHGQIQAEYGTDGTKYGFLTCSDHDAGFGSYGVPLSLTSATDTITLFANIAGQANFNFIGVAPGDTTRISMRASETGPVYHYSYITRDLSAFSILADDVPLKLSSANNTILVQGSAATPATTYLKVIGQDATHFGQISAEYGTDGTKYGFINCSGSDAGIGSYGVPLSLASGTDTITLFANIAGQANFNFIGVAPGDTTRISMRASEAGPVYHYSYITRDLSAFSILADDVPLKLSSANNTILAQGSAATPATTYLKVIGQDATHFGQISTEYGTDGTKYLSLYHDGTNAYISSAEPLSVVPDTTFQKSVTVNGTLTSQGGLSFTGDLAVKDGNQLQAWDTSNTKYISLYHDGTNALIQTSAGRINADIALSSMTDFPNTIANVLSDHNLANHPLSIIPNMDLAHIQDAADTRYLQLTGGTLQNTGAYNTYLRIYGGDAGHYGQVSAEYGTDYTKYLALWHDSVNGIILNTDGSLLIESKDNNIQVVGAAATADNTLLRVRGQDSGYYGIIRAESGTVGSVYLSLYHDGTDGYVYSNTGDLILKTTNILKTQSVSDIALTATGDISLSTTGGDCSLRGQYRITLHSPLGLSATSGSGDGDVWFTNGHIRYYYNGYTYEVTATQVG